MDTSTQENTALPDVALEAMLQELLKAQLALGKNISATSRFLRLALSLASDNLSVIRAQMEALQDLAAEIDARRLG